MAAKQRKARISKTGSPQVRRRGLFHVPDPLAIERLEDRSMLSQIVWLNRNDFGSLASEFGPNIALARAVIDQALLDWGSIIQDFNYRGGGNYRLRVDVKDIASPRLAEAGPTSLDADGKPFVGKLNIDSTANGRGWFFDSSPTQDYEFSNPITPFAITGGQPGYDLYAVVMHELGHALGLATNEGLAIRSHINNHVFRFNDGTTALLTPSDDHTDPTAHPNDLMNPSGSQSTRWVVSDLDARILGDGYGYSIDLDYVRNRSFVTTYNPTNRKLTVHGDLGTTQSPNKKYDQIYLNAVDGPNHIFVDVNGYSKRILTSQVDSIDVLGRDGDDEIRVVATRAGEPLTIDAGRGDNDVYLADQLRNLSFIQGDVHVFEQGGETFVHFRDENNTASRTFSIDEQKVTFSGSMANIVYGNHFDPTANIHTLVLRGGSGGNHFTVRAKAAAQTAMSIRAGAVRDVVDIFGVGVKGLAVNGIAGNDLVTIDGVAGLEDILGPVFVSNTNGLTSLVVDDSSDIRASRNIRLSDSQLTGVGISPINFDSRGIASLTLLASNDVVGGPGNLIEVVDTPQNRDDSLLVRLATGRKRDTIYVRRTSSELQIEGEDGLDDVLVGNNGSMAKIRENITVRNARSFTALSFDNHNDDRARNGAVSDSYFRLGQARVYFDERQLRSLEFLGGPAGGSFNIWETPQFGAGTNTTQLHLGSSVDIVNVFRTSDPLAIDGGGGEDLVNIGYLGQLGGINGVVDIHNPPIGGYTAITVDGSNDVGVHNARLDSASVRGLSPAEIRFRESDLASLTISAGNDGNVFDILDTPSNSRVFVTLNTGLGVDTVNVQRIRSSLNVQGQYGADVVNVGRNGSMEEIYATVSVLNSGSYSTLNLNQWAETQSHEAWLGVGGGSLGPIGIVTGMAPGEIIYRQGDLRALNIFAGVGSDTFTIANTVNNQISPTTSISGGQTHDVFQVLGTTGKLVITPEGNSNQIVVGGFAGELSGDLESLFGDVVLVGGSEFTENFVEIRDSSSPNAHAYQIDSQRIYRTDLFGGSPSGSVYLDQFPLNGLSLVGSDFGNYFRIDGTPIHPASWLPEPIHLIAGEGGDIVDIFGSNQALDVNLGGGFYQTVRIGDAAHSLDAIQGDVAVTGGGFIDAWVSDEASTTVHFARLDQTNGVQLLERYLPDDGGNILLNKFSFAFANLSELMYQAGRTGNVGHNQIDVVGLVPQIDFVAYGGSDMDVFSIGSGNGIETVQGRVTINSPQADNDLAFYYAYANSVPVHNTLVKSSNDPGGVIIVDEFLNTVTVNGVTTLTYYSPLIGGNSLDIRSLPDIYLVCPLGPNDAVNLGSQAPNLGGDMNAISGFMQFQSYHPDDVVQLTLDDSGNFSAARDVSISRYDLPGDWGFVSGLGSSSILFADHASWNLDIRGGGMNDTFVMRDSPLASRIRIDGGAGDDVLIGSGGNFLFGGAGRDLIVAGALASVLDGGLDEDLLIGGSLIDVSLQNLNAIRNAWGLTGTGHDYASRVANLRADLLADDKVVGNGGLDQLTGGSDALDLFFGEVATDIEETEQVVPLS